MHMDESELAKTTQRRSPAQKAAQSAGLPAGVALHQDAMGGFTESGRKPKRLKPGDLSTSKPKRRRKPLVPTPDQKVLHLPDDDVVVIPSMPAPKGPLELTDDEPDDEDEGFPLPQDGGLEDAARATLAQALYNEVGKPGSLLSHPTGVSFAIRPGLGEGEAHTQHRIRVPLPGGNTAGHVADLAIELEGGAQLVLDVLSSQSSLAQVKSHAFDALQLRGVSDCYAVLVFLNGHGGLARDHVEALAHGYDHFFGIEADHAKEAARYTALRARVAQWIKAASGKK